MTDATGASCGCGPATSTEDDRSRLDQAFVEEELDTPAGQVPRVSSELTPADRRGSALARWGIGRDDYRVVPGLYALGRPDGSSPALVSANYKMSFDVLRSALPGRDAWVLVLDTDGINVWCAAGKGTFGTDELVKRILESGLDMIVDRRRVIVPQLGAPGVAAHEVKKRTGFRVRYGPIEATDLPAFLDARGKATPQMRRKTFDLRERTVLVPVDLVASAKWGLLIAAVLFVLSGLGGPAGFLSNALTYGTMATASMALAIVAGAVLTPILLPWIPGRAFAVKGALIGGMAAVGLAGALALLRDPTTLSSRLEIAAWLLLVPAVSAFLAMNFTGASTYTSLSGVRKEMGRAVPLQAVATVVGLGLWIGARCTA